MLMNDLYCGETGWLYMGWLVKHHGKECENKADTAAQIVWLSVTVYIFPLKN